MVVKVDQEKCDGCETCVKICPTDAIKVTDGKAKVNDDCADCGTCIDECPKQAITQP
jgi:Fe-S-cluster-containing hydrogenase component 2